VADEDLLEQIGNGSDDQNNVLMAAFAITFLLPLFESCDAAAWIAAARLELIAGSVTTARQIIQQVLVLCWAHKSRLAKFVSRAKMSG
jgi:hypothetical protein